ncbi:DNA ligase 1 isoform X2 [Dermacentor variabilis]|uniref:DNA ligase 1 isoform X2 n=1 Tax=Dermacentor variabilis TaxID=34621 RepID=UPI003F5BF573
MMGATVRALWTCSSRAGLWRCVVAASSSTCNKPTINRCDRHWLAVCSRRSFFKTSAAASSSTKTEKEPPAAASTSPEKDVDEKDVNGHASPVKAPSRRRIRMISDSDDETDQKEAAPEKDEEPAAPSSSKTPSPPPAKSEEPVQETTIIKRRTARKTAKRSPEPNRLSAESGTKRPKTEAASEEEPLPAQASPPQDNKKAKTEPAASPKQEEMETESTPEADEKVEPKKEKEENEQLDKKKVTKASPPKKKEPKDEKPPKKSKSLSPKDEKAKEKPQAVAGKKLQNFAFTSAKSDQSSAVTCDYDPSKANYDPVEDACWKKGAKVPYLALAITLDKIDGISGRLRIMEVLSNFLRSVLILSPDDLLSAVYLCLNKIAPDYQGLELGIGESLLVKALAEATGRTPDKVRAEATAKGDLGLVAESSRSQQRVLFPPPPLMLSHVFTKLRAIAEMTGNSVQQKKVDIIKVLLVACRQCEARFLVRSLGGKLRIGLAEASLLTALAHAAALSPPHGDPKASKKRLEEAALLVKTAYCECPDYERLINALLEEGVDSLPKRCRLSPGIPLKPMLAHPTKAISEVLNRFEGSAFTCEFKYDGERAQIHLLEDGSVRIYSRNQEDNTGKYPEVVSRIRAAISPDTKTCILDSEAVAWDRPSQTILPFQTLSTRKRKETTEEEVKVQVCVFAFDLLYLNGESLVKEALRKRRELLRKILVEVPGETQLARSADLSTVEDIQEFLQESIKGSCEGLMVKSLDTGASYEIAKRSHNWLKLKKDYLDGVGDSVDAVVLGGYHGKGKRTGTFGCFLLGCYDPDNEEFQTLCKIGTGFSEEQLDQHSAFFKEHVIPAPKSYYRFDSSLAPDAWFEPCQVWEIKSADLSVSPVHKAALGLVDPEKGISLRFPRFIRIRDDKNPEDATSAQQVADLYNKQDHIKNKKAAVQETTADEDFY